MTMAKEVSGESDAALLCMTAMEMSSLRKEARGEEEEEEEDG